MHSQYTTALIRLHDVSRCYRLGETSVHALRNIDLTITAGDFVAIWGPSGSGKSTLCHLLGAVDTPTSGSVLINGKDIATLTDEEQAAHRNLSVGFIFQGFNLIRVLTALENVMMPLALRGTPQPACQDRARAILGELGLEDQLGHRPDQLSGGQQQRVAIARALVTQPPLVVADEPTANLDTENAEKIVDLMKGFNSRHGTTFVFSTHDQRLLDRVSRRIRLQDGSIMEDLLLSTGPTTTGGPPCS